MSENPITQLINTWRSRKDLAEEVGATVHVVHKWASNGRIPSGWQEKVVQAARKRGLRHVTAAWMLRVHSVDYKQEELA